ncbi:MAG: 50S ribosomal protein L13 [Candidatus Wallbacteria bacterium HGW-Wallbacteria-1]|jgi:large subunit ribosomal protein L13|uniref:Large ribosomal subunit protein uL13 n=1 Tax=Candidatus Wallbacteria bacterium HGW-Wallbacteria-1 TaxID=2013854 RepID=A0A2N1PST9_9BACT|nr:MAG: 50S ribosomal protein L13 [Candidatus Wallbacteria bacterium HGW-Wallbacteria-1]
MEKTTKFVRIEDINRKWFVVDAQEKILGRLATSVARVLRGKNKACYSPDRDLGDFVVVVNAEKVAVTGNKLLDKKYYRHSGYRGNLKVRTMAEQLQRHPEEVVRHAVKGMLPKNHLGRQMMKRLRIFTGDTHTHTAQKPETLAL